MGRYKLLLWDYDGTVCDTSRAITACLGLVVEQLSGMALHQDELGKVLGMGMPLEATFDILLRKAGVIPCTDSISHAVTLYREAYPIQGSQLEVLFEGIDVVLARCKQADVLSVVVSNKLQKSVENSIDRFGLVDYFDQVVGSAPGRQGKPHPMKYVEIVARSYPTIPASATLFIGDTETDLRFAHQCGIAACWAAYGFGCQQSCKQLAPLHSIDSPIELLPLI